MALVVAHENITAGTYLGENAEFLAANMLFRSGGTAAVLSSRRVSAHPWLSSAPAGFRSSELALAVAAVAVYDPRWHCS